MAPSACSACIVNNRAAREDRVDIEQSRESVSHIDGELCMSTVREELI
jgi:hypothetical protein